MTRLLHLNGPPGIGKSTIARWYAEEHPGVLNCDIDVLRSLVGGWRDDFGAAGALIRPAALAMITAYLAAGHDVVLPQLILRLSELERFEAAATAAGADFVECVLMDSEPAVVARFRRRGGSGPVDPWHELVREIVDSQGGDEELRRCHRGLEAMVAQRPGAVVVTSTEGDIDETCRAVLAALA